MAPTKRSQPWHLARPAGAPRVALFVPTDPAAFAGARGRVHERGWCDWCSARGLVHVAEEDFAMALVEAQVAATAVIAFAAAEQPRSRVGSTPKR